MTSEIVNNREWNSWRWQLRHSIRSLGQLKKYLPRIRITSGLEKVYKRYPMAITPYYAKLIHHPDDSDPVFRIAVAQAIEIDDKDSVLPEDPLGEDRHVPVAGLIRRYKNRALIISTAQCAVFCRHCSRKRFAGSHSIRLTGTELKNICTYLKQNPEINDVIISGGDPLLLDNSSLKSILLALRSIKSVEIIRIGTRTPVVLPMRINARLVNTLKEFHPLYINTHFNHPVEITREATRACALLADAGIPLGNQTVLLKNVNDNAAVLAELFNNLLKIRVKPYYLFHCDSVKGARHFKTSVNTGRDIMKQLRSELSQIALPAYVMDTHDKGKIAL